MSLTMGGEGLRARAILGEASLCFVLVFSARYRGATSGLSEAKTKEHQRGLSTSTKVTLLRRGKDRTLLASFGQASLIRASFPATINQHKPARRRRTNQLAAASKRQPDPGRLWCPPPDIHYRLVIPMRSP